MKKRKTYYELCKSVYFESKKLEELGKLLNISKENLLENAKSEMRETFSEEEIEERIKEFKQISFENKVLPKKNGILKNLLNEDIYVNWRTKEEKSIVLDACYQKLSEQLTREDFDLKTLEKENPLKPNTYVAWGTEKEKKEFLKYCFHLCENAFWNNIAIKNASEQIGYKNQNKLFWCACDYALDYLKWSDDYLLEEIKRKREQQTKEKIPVLIKPNPILKQMGINSPVYAAWRNEKEKKIVTGNCYQYAKKYFFDDFALDLYAGLFGFTTTETIWKMIKIYAIEFLGMEQREYQKLVKIWKSDDIGKENEILKSYGIKGVTKNWRNKEERKIILKHFYEFGKSVSWDDEKIEEEADKINKTTKETKRYAEAYAKEFLGISNEEFQRNWALEKYPNYRILEQLIKEKDPEKINEILDNVSSNLYFLKTRLWDFAVNFYPEEKESVEKRLLVLIENYLKKRKSEKKEEKAKRNAEQIKDEFQKFQEEVEEFLETKNENLQEFLESKGYSKWKIQKYLELLKIQNNVLYQKWIEKVETKRSQRFAILCQRCQLILNYLKSGIVIDNEIRQFDLIDYYQLFSYDFATFLRIYKEKMSKSEIILTKKFMAKYETDKPISWDDILNWKIEYDFEKDKKGFPIAGTGKILSEEEKRYIVNILKENKIPVTVATFNLARQRNRSHTLENTLIRKRRK